MAKFLDNWKNKVTTYKNKAEEIRAMIEEGAETIRDIRADVEGTVEDLKADSEVKMMESLEKIQTPSGSSRSCICLAQSNWRWGSTPSLPC